MSALGTIARTAGTDSRPSPTAETGEFFDQNGADDPAALGADDFSGDKIGGRLKLSGLLALDSCRDVALVYAILAARLAQDREAYMNAKSPHVQEILQLASRAA